MDQLSLIQKRLEPELKQMNEIIRQSLATTNDLMDRVVQNYLKVKGKQIRPIMVLLSAAMFGEITLNVLRAGAALEMLHNASLIHDDVVDETDLRRGKNTINREWGNQIAVLVGDFFVSNALATGIQTGNLEIVTSLSDLGKELSLGEVDQICNAREHSFEEARYLDMIEKKTASLFINCVKMGAEAVGATREMYADLMEFARLLGLSFQIKDDIFDYTPSPEIGKPTGNDLKEGKVTLPLLYALRTALNGDAEKMKDLLIKGDLSESEINALLYFAIENKGIDYAYNVMRDMQQEAEKKLAGYPDSQWKQSFLDLFEYIITRKY